LTFMHATWAGPLGGCAFVMKAVQSAFSA